MCFLNFVSVRNRRKSLVKQLLKKIQKKKQHFKRKSPPPPRIIIRDPTYTFYTGDGICVIGNSSVKRLPPPPAAISSIWNTNKEKDVRNWVELPPEVTLRVFMKLETVEIILSVSQVCSSWRGLSREPILYRSIIVSGYDLLYCGRWWEGGFLKIIMEAVDRSCGKLEKFSCGNMTCFRSIDDLRYVVASSNSLISLRLGFCQYININEILEFVKSIPSLEELYLHGECFSKGIFHGFSSQKLRCFQIGVLEPAHLEQVLEIGKHMPYLRCLRLLANGLTNKGLQAIINGCSHLEYIYLKGFSNLEVDSLKRHCDRIKSFTVLNRGEYFGEECELYMKANSCIREFSYMAEEVCDYGRLPLYNSSFDDYIEQYFMN